MTKFEKALVITVVLCVIFGGWVLFYSKCNYAIYDNNWKEITSSDLDCRFGVLYVVSTTHIYTKLVDKDNQPKTCVLKKYSYDDYLHGRQGETILNRYQ